VFSLNPPIGSDVFVLCRDDDPAELGTARLDWLRRTLTDHLSDVGFDDAIRVLTDENHEIRDPALGQKLLRLRYRAGAIRRIGRSEEPIDAPEPAAPMVSSPDGDDPTAIPSWAATDATPDAVRAAIERRGAAIVRGVVTPAMCRRLVTAIDETFDAIGRRVVGEGVDAAPWVVPFSVEDDLGGLGRFFEISMGRMWAVDAPVAGFDAMTALADPAFRSLVVAVLGDRPVLPVARTAIRRTPAEIPPTWWQECYVSGLGAVGLGLSLHLDDDGPERPLVELVPWPTMPVLRHEHDIQHPPVGVQDDDIAAHTDLPPVAATLGAGDVLLTAPGVVRRDAPGTYPATGHSIEALVVGASACPYDAHPLWW
jgi:hypothetical protein